MNRSLLSVLGRIVFASASVVIFQTAANAQEGQLSAIGSKLEAKINQEQQIIDNPGENEQILAQRSTRRRERRENNAAVPEAVADAVIKNLSQQTGIEASGLKVEEAKQITWTDGCLGLGSPGLPCSEGRVPGWEVVVGSGSQRWVYRSNMSGSLVKLDAIATQAIASRPSASQTSEETASGTERQTTTSSRRAAGQTSSQSRSSGESASRTERQTTSSRRAAGQTSSQSRSSGESASRTERQTTTSSRRAAGQTSSQSRSSGESASRTEGQTTTSSRRAAGQTSNQTRSSGESASRTEGQTTTSSRGSTDQVSRETRASQQAASASEAQATSSRRPTDQVARETRASQETASQTEGQTTTTPRRLAQQPSSQTMMEGKGEFSIAVWQPSANLSEVVTRLSVKSRQGDSFSSERYIGDYRYRVNQRAKFMGGINPGDRVVARLYNFQNQLIGYSEFEVLPQNMAVNLILGNRPLVTRVVRTVYGIDADRNVTIDRGAEIFDYYTQITGTTPSQERVTFMGDSQNIDKTWFQVAGLPVPPQTSVYPSSYASASSQTVNVYSSDLPAAISANPQDSVVNIQTDNTYNLAQQTRATQQATRSTQQTRPTQQATRSTQETSATQQATRSTQETTLSEVQASFADVPSDFWAKSFISQLAVKGVLQGYPDGLYRPRDTVTRAEFATIISGAFRTDRRREVVAFKDVPTNHWAYPAIRDAYERGFLDADSSRNFNPDEKISRLDVLVALAKGLNYSPSGSADKVLRVYRDAATIPRSDRTLVAAVTERNIVVNYPNVRSLNPRREATRAEVAALIYRALVSTGDVGNISSPYLVQESTAQEEVREQPRPTQRRQTQPVRRTNNNNRQPQPVRRSGSTNSSDTNRVRRTNTVQRSNTNNSVRRANTVQRSNTNNSVRRANTVQRSNTNNSVRNSSTPKRES